MDLKLEVVDRRHFLATAAMTFALRSFAKSILQKRNQLKQNKSLGTLKQIDAGVLNAGYAEAGPAELIEFFSVMGRCSRDQGAH
jgi:hypothetical protein